jgi:hypothetical protein
MLAREGREDERDKEATPVTEQTGGGHGDIVAEIIARTWKDPDFKQELLTNPKAALREQFEIEVPAEVDLTVLEESKSHVYLVLPSRPRSPSEQPSEQELREWASGHTAQTVCNSTWTEGFCGPHPR